MFAVFVPVFYLPTQLTRIKTEASFVAEDPWNGNRPCTFTLDSYAVTLRGAKSVPKSAWESPWVGGFHRALRSESDGTARFLPESLIELWLRRQVSMEALPALLKQIEPGVRKSDYKPILHSLSMKIFGVFETICCAGLVVIAVVAVVTGQLPWWLAAAVVAGTASICWLFVYQVYWRMLFRRKRQMRWLLERIRAGSPAPTADPILPRKPPTTPEQSQQPARKFVSSILPADADALAVLNKLRAALPELAWQGGERSSGSIHLAGESREAPSKVGIHLLCKQPPGPFTLTIRLEPTDRASADAEALKARVVKALVAAPTPRPTASTLDDLFLQRGPLPPPPPLISPQPMPLQTVVLSTTLEGKEIQRYRIAKGPLPTSPDMAASSTPKDFEFKSVMTVPEVMEPAMEPRLRKAFPELDWEDFAENRGEVRIEGTSRETPRRVVISIVRNESSGTFKLGSTVIAQSESEAVKSLKAILDRLQSALLGWSQFHLPQFKIRPPTGIDIDREDIVDLVFPLERGQIRLFQANAMILISRILLEALAVHGEILDNRAKNPEKYPYSNNPEGLAARARGAAARLVVGQGVPTGSGKDLDAEMALVREAHSLVGELLENGLAQVVPYGPGGARAANAPSLSPRRIKVHYFGSGGFGHIFYSGADGEAGNLGEFLRLDWWSSRSATGGERAQSLKL